MGLGLGDVYQHSSSNVKEVKPGRLVTFLDRKNVRDARTGKQIYRLTALMIEEAVVMYGKMAVIITGRPAKLDGSIRANGNPQKVIACRGSFMVWWRAEDD